MSDRCVTTALATGMYLATAFGGNYARAAPDPAVECANPDVTCIAPGGNWHTEVFDALAIGNTPYLTDQDLNTKDADYIIPSAASLPIPLSGLGNIIRGEGRLNTTIRGDGTQIAITR